jgi:phospholipase/carboxylesterase
MPSISEWPHLYRPGDGPVLVMLHGTGSDEHDIATLAERLDPTAAVLAPRGQVSEAGATRWFRRRAEGVFDVADVRTRAAELATFIGQAVAEYGLADRPLVAVGFSNGANMATATALLHPGTLSRVIAFSGMYPFADEPAPDDLSDLHLLLLNGSSDPMAPSTSVDRLEAELQRGGASYSRSTREGGHGITDTELTTAQEWLSTELD